MREKKTSKRLWRQLHQKGRSEQRQALREKLLQTTHKVNDKDEIMDNQGQVCTQLQIPHLLDISAGALHSPERKVLCLVFLRLS
jgi:hypothetical protein